MTDTKTDPLRTALQLIAELSRDGESRATAHRALPAALPPAAPLREAVTSAIEPDSIFCSVCGSGRSQVSYLIPGRREFYICNLCVDECHGLGKKFLEVPVSDRIGTWPHSRSCRELAADLRSIRRGEQQTSVPLYNYQIDIVADVLESEHMRSRPDVEEWVSGWHRCVETMLTIAGLSCALGADEAAEAFQKHWESLASAPQPAAPLREALYFEPSGDGMAATIHDADGRIICEAKYDEFEENKSRPETIMKQFVALTSAQHERATAENLREAWSAMAMIREAIETLGPVGAVQASEHLDGPTFMHEADALVKGVRALAGAAVPQERVDRAAVIEECAQIADGQGEDIIANLIRALANAKGDGK